MPDGVWGRGEMSSVRGKKHLRHPLGKCCFLSFIRSVLLVVYVCKVMTLSQTALQPLLNMPLLSVPLDIE